jgi:NAD(P)-dependent dehydrogenase (short-subunit alcohol dehydrogenase family)
MKSVCVITGGGSGMGLATARILGLTHKIVICGRTLSRLDVAIAELTAAGVEATAVACDVADRSSVESLAKAASKLGSIAIVIHAAGISPQMAGSEEILRINAIGTLHVHDAFYPLLANEGCLIDVGSVAGHMIPQLLLPTLAYPLGRSDPARFLKKMLARVHWFPTKLRTGFAYGISKHFVMWLVRVDADRFAQKGVRMLSVSAGSFATDMGALAKEGADELTKFCAIRRYGDVEEIAQLLAMCTDRQLGYLTGTDILCDGGCLAGTRNDPLGFLRMQLKFATS